MTKRCKRRWFQYSLRTLLIFTLVAGLGFGLLGQRIKRVRDEGRATAELEKLGADIGFRKIEGVPIPDRWLWKWFGDGPVLYVRPMGPRMTKADLEDLKEHLNGLTDLERLLLGDTQITDAGLKHLKGLTNLEWLNLNGAQVTDAGLEHLKGLANLKDLYLRETGVAEEGVAELQKALPRCKITH